MQVVLLSLLWSLTQVARRLSLLYRLLACSPESSERRVEIFIGQAGDRTPAEYDEGHGLQVVAPQQGRGDTITLAHPDGPYMQIHIKVRKESNSFR